MYDELKALVPEFDPDAIINYPGRHKGAVQTDVPSARRAIERSLRDQAEAGSSIARSRPRMLLHLRSRWYGLYLKAMESEEAAGKYQALLGLDPRVVRGRQRIVAVQIIGAIEEKLRAADTDVSALTTTGPNSELAQVALDIAKAGRSVLAHCQASTLSVTD